MTKRKYLNNYLYITDQSIDEFNNFGKVRLKMKYGRGTSHKEYRNTRTEQRLNCNAPHSDFETLYRCKNHKIYTDKEKYTLTHLKKKYKFAKDLQTGNDHEFFYSLEEVHSLKEINSIWLQVQLDVITIHNKFDNLQFEEIIEEIEESGEESGEETESEEENVNNIVDYTKYDATMSLSGAQIISSKFDGNYYDKPKHLLSEIVKYCYYKDINLNINEGNKLIGGDYYKERKKQKKASNQKWNYKEIITDELYLLGMNSEANFKEIIKLQKMVKFPLELKILLKE